MDNLLLANQLLRSARRFVWPASLMAAALATAGVTGMAVAASTAHAQAAPSGNGMVISSVIEVESRQRNADGTETVSYADPGSRSVFPGDRLRITLRWSNNSAEPVTNFVATNPINPAIKYDAAREDWAVVSVDGGKSFGKLADLTVADSTTPGKVRPAQAEDVTHVRWTFATAVAPGAAGTLAFSGSVR